MGVNVQKYSFVKNAALEPALQKPYVKQPLWGVGLVLVILGSLGDFAALGLAAQSIVAPIGAITLVSNVLFAHFGNKEPITRRDILGTCLIIIGSTLSVAFGNHAEVTYTMEELKDLYLAEGFAGYAFTMLAVVTALYVLIKRLQPMKEEMVEKCQAYEKALQASPRDPQLIQELDERIAELEAKYEKWAKIHPFSYCALSGTIGAQSILFGKMLAEMMGASIRGDNQMIYPLTYVFLACMLFCIFSQLHWLALGLRFFDALYVVPVFQCFFISVSTLGGAAYFSEFSAFGPLQVAFFPIGILFTLSGVYILSSRDMKKKMTREEPHALLSSDETGVETMDSAGDTLGASDADECAIANGEGEAGEVEDLETGKVHRLCVPGSKLAPADSSASARETASVDYERVVDSSLQLADRSARSGMTAPLASNGVCPDDDVEALAGEEDIAGVEGTGGKYFVPRPSSSNKAGVLGKPLTRQPSAAMASSMPVTSSVPHTNAHGIPMAAAVNGNQTPRGGLLPGISPVSLPVGSDSRPPTYSRQPSRQGSIGTGLPPHSTTSRPGTGDHARSQFARRMTAGSGAFSPSPLALYNEGVAAGFGRGHRPAQSMGGNQTPRMSPASGVGASDGAGHSRRATAVDRLELNPKRSTWTGRDEEGRMLKGSILEAGFAVLGVPTGVDVQ